MKATPERLAKEKQGDMVFCGECRPYAKHLKEIRLRYLADDAEETKKEDDRQARESDIQDGWITEI
jgi:hypothetical protein